MPTPFQCCCCMVDRYATLAPALTPRAPRRSLTRIGRAESGRRGMLRPRSARRCRSAHIGLGRGLATAGTRTRFSGMLPAGPDLCQGLPIVSLLSVSESSKDVCPGWPLSQICVREARLQSTAKMVLAPERSPLWFPSPRTRGHHRRGSCIVAVQSEELDDSVSFETFYSRSLLGGLVCKIGFIVFGKVRTIARPEGSRKPESVTRTLSGAGSGTVHKGASIAHVVPRNAFHSSTPRPRSRPRRSTVR